MLLSKPLVRIMVTSLIVITMSGAYANISMSCDDPKREWWQDCCLGCSMLWYWPAIVTACVTACTIAYLAAKCADPEYRQPSYIPRFDPETILHNLGDFVLLRAGRYDCASEDFLLGQGDVTSVQFYVVDFGDYPQGGCWEDAPWVLIGNGAFDGTSMWTVNWQTPSSLPVSGYALRVDFNDYIEGLVQGIGAAGVRTPDGAAPSLTRWSLIIMLMLLAGIATWVVLKRKRVAPA